MEVAIEEVKTGFDVHVIPLKLLPMLVSLRTRQEAKAHTFAPLYGATGFGRTPAEANTINTLRKNTKELGFGIPDWLKKL